MTITNVTANNAEATSQNLSVSMVYSAVNVTESVSSSN